MIKNSEYSQNNTIILIKTWILQMYINLVSFYEEKIIRKLCLCKNCRRKWTIYHKKYLCLYPYWKHQVHISFILGWSEIKWTSRDGGTFYDTTPGRSSKTWLKVGVIKLVIIQLSLLLMIIYIIY